MILWYLLDDYIALFGYKHSRMPLNGVYIYDRFLNNNW